MGQISTILAIVQIIRRLWPLLAPVLPIILKVFEDNKEVLEDLVKRPNTTPAEDARDMMKKVTRPKKKGQFDPFTKYYDKPPV